MEHATFLEHLVFCHDYWLFTFRILTSRHVVAFYSGNRTNTFAMEASKIDALKALLDDFEFIHEAFPSILRLLANLDSGRLNAVLHRLNESGG